MKTTSILKILRESKSYSQDYVGSVLGIEQNTYSKLENGQIRLTIDRVYKLAELYNVPIDLLISKDLPNINYNTGICSKGNINTERYTESVFETSCDKLMSLKDKIIEEKDMQIADLKIQLEEKKCEIRFWRDKVLNEKLQQ